VLWGCCRRPSRRWRNDLPPTSRHGAAHCTTMSRGGGSVRRTGVVIFRRSIYSEGEVGEALHVEARDEGAMRRRRR